MQKNSVADVLRALATGDKARSETSRLRDVVDEVEAALSAGVSRVAILEALHGQGFAMTLKSFESALYRIRKQRGSTGQQTAQPAPLPPVTPAAPTTAPASVSAPAEAAPEVSEPAGRDDLAGLTKKQKRERIADEWIKPEATNPLLKNILNKKD